MNRGPFAGGDIVWMSFDPQKGHEQAGTRPALVMSRTGYNQRSDLVLVCPITSKRTSWPLAIPVSAGRIVGSILIDHARSMNWRVRRPVWAAQCPAETLALATATLASLIEAA